jgi:hypothetical protein
MAKNRYSPKRINAATTTKHTIGLGQTFFVMSMRAARGVLRGRLAL